MTLYRMLVDQPQKDGSVVREEQNIEIPDGEPVPEGAVPLPPDALPIEGDGIPYKVVGSEAVQDVEAIRSAELNRIAQQEQVSALSVVALVEAVAMVETWREIKQIERDFAAGKLPLPGQPRNEEYPFLAAIAYVAGSTIEAALPIAKTYLWPKMVDVSLHAARALIARHELDQRVPPTA